MPRNFQRRVEIGFPIDDPVIRHEMIDDVLPTYLRDRVKARELQADGTYVRMSLEEGARRSQAQLHFRNRARTQAKTLADSQAAPAVKLMPITIPKKDHA